MAYEVFIAEYNPGWIQEFEQERAKLQSALHDKSIVTEHIGSTSIEGLPSKPIVDIAIGVNDLEKAHSFIAPLGELGYEYVPKADFPNRRFFRKGEWRRGTHHLHVYDLRSNEWNDNLLFRNYLRTHPEKVQEYAQLKQRLASQYADDRNTYTKQKAPFIKSVLELAKRQI